MSKFLVRANCEYSIEVEASDALKAMALANEKPSNEWEQAWSPAEAELAQDDTAGDSGVSAIFRATLGVLFKRYLGMSAVAHTCVLCETALLNIHAWPEDKLNRWLGFVQCLVVHEGRTTVQAERDFTRPLFHRCYRAAGLVIPESVGVSTK